MYEPKMFLNTFLGWSTSSSDNSSGDDEAAALVPGSVSCSVSVDGLSRYVHGENGPSAVAVRDVDGSAYGKDCAKVDVVDVATPVVNGAQSSLGLSTRAYIMTAGRRQKERKTLLTFLASNNKLGATYKPQLAVTLCEPSVRPWLKHSNTSDESVTAPPTRTCLPGKWYCASAGAAKTN